MFFTNLHKNSNVWAAIVFLLAAYLTLFNLGYVTLWHDEAPNAVMARNFLNTGTFTAWDGRNLYVVGGNNAAVSINKNLNMTHSPWPEPPLAAIPSAIGMVVFGENEVGIRFFHGILGLLSLFFLWRLLKLDFVAAPRLQVLAFSLFALSTQVILFMRQGRYYAGAFLFVLASFYCYRLYISANGKLWHLLLAALLTVLNFLNHFAIGISTAIAFAIWHILYYRHQTSRRQWLELVGLGTGVAGVCVLYLWLIGVVGGDEQLGKHLEYQLAWIPRHITLLRYYIRDIAKYAWLPLWVFVWLAFFIFCYYFLPTHKRKGKRKRPSTEIDKHIMRWVALAFIILIVSSLTSVQPASHKSADSRYLLGALPFLILITAASVDWIWQRYGMRYALPVLAALLFSTLPGYPFLHPGVFAKEKLKWTLPSLVREIHRPYATAVEDITEYLEEHIKQDDTIYVEAWQEQALLHFYLGDKLIFCCYLDDKDGISNPRIKALGAPLYKDDVKPIWYIARKKRPPAEYEQVFISPSFFYPTQRPEIEYRSFAPLTPPADNFHFKIYRLKQQYR